MKTFFKLLPLLLLTALTACKKDKKNDPEPTPAAPASQTGSLKLSFENMVDTLPLVFGQNYRNANGDTFQVSQFNYYISNIVFVKADNSTYAEPNSYHLVKHSDLSTRAITVSGLPYGTYTAVKFLLGVDSTRNTSGAQTGDLVPVVASDMYWTWSSGYVTMKLEGTSPQSGSQDKTLTFHIGGFGGVNKAQRPFNLGFSGQASVAASATPVVHLAVNANRIFSPDTIRFATQYDQVSPGPGAKVYADNYAGMIQFKQLSN